MAESSKDKDVFEQKRAENKSQYKDYSLGRLYGGIRSEKLFTEDEYKTEKVTDHPYVAFCKKIYKLAPTFGKSKKFTEEMESYISFLGWKIQPQELDGASKIFSAIAISSAFLLTILIYIIYYILSKYIESLTDISFLNSGTVAISSVVIFGAIAGFAIYYFLKYPITVAEREQRLALAYLPQIVGYLTMSLKLVPNIERAVKFAALQGKGKLADDFRKLLWDVNVGVYSTVGEGLDFLAYRWKKYSSEFKEAVMMIKSSMVEDNDARRAELLDRTVDNVLGSIKTKMDVYARSLSQPSLVLFYVGILLPLLLVIILPIGSVFSQLPFANPYVLALLYDIVLPLFVFFYARHVIKSVPSIYRPPAIPDGFKGLPKKGYFTIGGMQIPLKIFVGAIFVIGILLSFFMQAQFGITMQKVFQAENMPQQYIDNPDLYFEFIAKEVLSSKEIGVSDNVYSDQLTKEMRIQKLLFTMQPGHDVTPYYMIYGFAFTLAMCIFIYFFFHAKYKKKVQDYYVNMEYEFKEILYILASRLGEGKPMEDAMQSTKEFFSDLTISQDLLAKTLDNINLLGMPLEQALFDPMFGSLKNNPSLMIRNNLQLISDAVNLGVNTGAKTIISIGVQLKNTDEIKDLVRKVTQDIVQMMTTMSTIVAPAVLGITTAMQKIIVLTLNSLASSGISSTTDSIKTAGVQGIANAANILGSFNLDSISGMATTAQFNIIIVIYVVLLVIILSYFTSRLDADNPLATELSIAYTVPIAVTIFIIASFIAGLLLGGTG